MSFLAAIPIIGGLFSKTAGAVVAVKDAWSGHKGRETTQTYNKDMGILAGYLSEFTSLNPKRNWWDSLWDGVNRMPRPAFVGIVFWFIAVAINDPVKFQLILVKLSAVPLEMWGIVTVIISFYFGGRISKYKSQSDIPLSDAKFKTLLENIDKIEEIRKKRLEIEEAEKKKLEAKENNTD